MDEEPDEYPQPFQGPQVERITVEVFRGVPQVVVSLRCVVVVFALINFSSHSVPQTHDHKKDHLRSLKKHPLLKRTIWRKSPGWGRSFNAGKNFFFLIREKLKSKLLFLALFFYLLIQTGNLKNTSMGLSASEKEWRGN